MSDDEWTWELSANTQDDLDALSPEEQEQIIEKLDEITTSPWRDPPDYGEPLQNSPYKKIRIGEFRLSVAFKQDTRRLVVARIKRRDGAYTADDD
jgi:mRNA interferase RelE/StbE